MKVGGVWLPLHSAIVYYFAVHVVEKPQLLPSFLLFGMGWVMIANMLNRCSHPNPWHNGHGFAHHWNVLTRSSYRTSPKEIRSMQGHKEASKLEAKFKQRIEDEDDAYYKQVELDAKIKSISDEAVIRTKANASNALVDPISAVAGKCTSYAHCCCLSQSSNLTRFGTALHSSPGAKLLPYQQRLGRYCNKMRYAKNVMNWNESVIAFFTTLMLFGAGFAALFVPWGFVILWSSRILVWVGLGPWMKIFDMLFEEEAEIQKKKARAKAMDLFHLQRKAAKTFREHALKMKAFRVRLFGTYITRLPDFNLVRHEDVPLPESSAEPYVSKREVAVDKFVPSQDLTGEMIPMTGQDDEAETAKRKKQEKESLLAQYRTMADDPDSFAASDEDDADLYQGFELIGTEDSVVCVQEGAGALTNCTGEAPSRESSVRDVAISDSDIQFALDKELDGGTKMSAKTRWVFSARLSVFVGKERVEETPAVPAIEEPKTPALCDDTHEPVGQLDAAPEEGVEVVPFVSNDDPSSPANQDSESERVSVLYVDETAKKNDGAGDEAKEDNAEETVNDEPAVVKRVQFKETLSEIEFYEAKTGLSVSYSEEKKEDGDDCLSPQDVIKKMSFE